MITKKGSHIGSEIRVALFVFLFFQSTFSSGQVLVCGTPDPSGKETLGRETTLHSLKDSRSAEYPTAANPVFLPIRFHVLRRSNGTDGATTSDLNKVLSTLNSSFATSGIQFYMAGSIPDFIDNDTYFEFDYSEEAALCSQHDLPNAINLYVPGIITNGGSSLTGYGYYPSTNATSNRLFVRKDRLLDNKTVAHEMGHYFNLLHTFYNNSNAILSVRELVTRGEGANCAGTGDLLCDTPADPFELPNTTTTGCTYTGTATDANGQLFAPSLSNLMSYYYACGNEFTAGQYTRMGDGLLLRTNPTNQYTLDYAASAEEAPANLLASLTDNGVLLTFSDTSSNESGYIIERATAPAGPYVSLTGLAPDVTTFLDADLRSNTTYYYRVRASNSSRYSTLSSVEVGRQYCRPSYATACSPVLIADFILSDGSGTLINNVNTDCGSSSYSDHTGLKAEVKAGENYAFTARAVAGGAGSYYQQHLTIWVDFNQNGTFDSGEMAYQSTETAQMTPTVAGTMSIPMDAFPGETRMRVRSQYHTYGPVTDPCAQLAFGEAEDYTLNITNDKFPLPAPLLTATSTTLCEGEKAVLTATSCAGTLTWSHGATGTSVEVSPTVTTSYTATCTQDGCTGPASDSLIITVLPKIKATLGTDATVRRGDSTLLTISRQSGTFPWGFTLSDGSVYENLPDSIFTVFLKPTVTTTYHLTQVQDKTCGVGEGSGTATVTVVQPVKVDVQVKVFLEGPYRSTTQTMTTALNQRGLLPGQVPLNSSAPPTPAGQPYYTSPWNYPGTEAVSVYPADVVDWVLVSLRSPSRSVTEVVYRGAALLHANGTLSFPGSAPELFEQEEYYLVVEHRNHLGVLSERAIKVEKGQLSYDFSQQDSFTATTPRSVGQKKIGTLFAMLSCDGNQKTPNQHYDINVSDFSLWKGANGLFDRYLPTDFNLDAQVSVADKVLWNRNNGKFSMIGRQ
ncbi:MAG TPA: GEVED domain-containing protein [Telluribacter sp.]|nr:GEVED domain-containing protein [Telluribacter sp.]